jgi:hypothetical protein
VRCFIFSHKFMTKPKIISVLLICVTIISCEQKVQPLVQAANSDSVAKTNLMLRRESDSIAVLNKIIKSITDTLPEFLHVKPVVGKGNCVRQNNFNSIFLYAGDSITNVSLDDSLNGITVLYYTDGKLMSVFRSYNAHSFFWEKEYDRSGKLISEGMKLEKGQDIPLGKWTFYAATGRKDSVVDHDKDYKISYADAKKIAEKQGWDLSEISISFYYDVLSVQIDSVDAKDQKVVTSRIIWVNGAPVPTDYWEIIYKGKNNPKKNPTPVLQINAHTGKKKFVETETTRLCS